MDKKEQIARFNNNLMMPNTSINTYELPLDFILLRFVLHPIYSRDKQCKIMVKVKESKRYQRIGIVIPSSHTLTLYIYKTIEIDCIVFLFTRLLLPNVVYTDIKHEIQLPHLNIKTYEILQLSEVLERKIFYEKYKDKLGVDLRE